MNPPDSTPIFAVSPEDLAAAIERAGSAATEAGISFDTLTADVTKAQEILARSGAVIGNALRTIYERLTRPEVQLKLAALTEQDEIVISAAAALERVKAQWPNLSAEQRIKVAELLGGVYQITIALSILS